VPGGISLTANPSRLQDDVISVLASIGLQPEEEVLTKSGYHIDALVEANGKKIGIEVDGPTHFVGRKPTGSMLLKHRQVNTLDEIEVISVPYWEWDSLGRMASRSSSTCVLFWVWAKWLPESCNLLSTFSHHHLLLYSNDIRVALWTNCLVGTDQNIAHCVVIILPCMES